MDIVNIKVGNNVFLTRNLTAHVNFFLKTISLHFTEKRGKLETSREENTYGKTQIGIVFV